MDKLAKQLKENLICLMKLIRRKILLKKKMNQVHLCFNTRGVAKTSEHKYPSALISNVLGGGMSSRLFQKIREERGLAYLSTLIQVGLITVVFYYLWNNKNDYGDVIAIIEEEIKDIKNTHDYS